MPARPPGTIVKHLLTVDVESVNRAAGSDGPPDTALEPALITLLDFLAHRRSRAVFFVLASELPGLGPVLREAIRAGHEAAAHGLAHRRVDRLGPDAFRADLRDAKHRLEDAVQRPCVSYRAPWFSAPRSAAASWFFETLAEEGIRTDFSLRLPLTRAAAFRSPIPSLRERPVPLVPWGGLKVGVLGGLALRVLPKGMIRGLLRAVSRAGVPACVYLHPYEWYPAAAAGRGLRRRLGLARTLPRLAWLLGSEPFENVEETYA
jgi:peptidoglycan/xylan/chitin deacetylase (PgdA/CDA1 family)